MRAEWSSLWLCRVATEEGEANEEDDSQFGRFLDTALGSAYEVETQLLISKNVGYINDELYQTLLKELVTIEKQLTAFINKVRNS